MVCLVLSRLHYTVDVLIGYWLTVCVFAIYHTICDVPHHVCAKLVCALNTFCVQERRRCTAGRIIVLGRIVRYLEARTPHGRLSNRCALPIALPYRLDTITVCYSIVTCDMQIGHVATTAGRRHVGDT